MAVHKGHASPAAIAAAEAASAAPAAPKKVLVRLKGRAILEPGCITVEAGHQMEIPARHFDPQHHELVNPPTVAQAAAAGPPAAAEVPQPSAVSDEDQDDIRLFEDPK
jgi:hypothetical protein